MIRVVLDTNILFSAILKSKGLEAAVFNLVIDGTLLPCVSQAVLEEYSRVLTRPVLQAHADRVRHVLDLTASISVFVTPTTTVAESRDKDDNRFLECAEAAEAHFLVTGNTRHFPAKWKSTQRVTARELLEIIGAKLPEKR
jgi:putative PIN family toxin of toxin-antitoxin system